MNTVKFLDAIKNIGIDTFFGVPDSTLKPICSYMLEGNKTGFDYYTAANEGGAVGMAIGHYLYTGKPACVYMQNSGIGNAVNPITSLVNKDVYDIPMLFVVGWRGQPGTKDEPQHRCMGRITKEMLEVLEIDYASIGGDTTEGELKNACIAAKKALDANKQFAFLIERGALENDEKVKFSNSFSLIREEAIDKILDFIMPDDIVVSTTGKISREIYERCEARFGHHSQCFLTVGGMGHASMIAYGIALRCPGRRVICVEGDGAVLMHMGSLAIIGQSGLNNFVHICINNCAHESVGGMPTCAPKLDMCKMACSAGYASCKRVESVDALEQALGEMDSAEYPKFVEVCVGIGSRKDLGRPKESAVDNKKAFMTYHRQRGEEK